MGVIEDLKREAERRKQELSEEEACKVRKGAAYKNEIRPAMQAVFRYLNEMTEHLNFLKPEVGIRYTLPGYGEIRNLVQEDYRMAVDSTEQPKFIKLWFTCRSPDRFSVYRHPQVEGTGFPAVPAGPANGVLGMAAAGCLQQCHRTWL